MRYFHPCPPFSGTYIVNHGSHGINPCSVNYKTKRFFYRKTSIKANDGVWHHICVSWENSLGSWKFYKDGDLKKDRKDFKKGYTIKKDGALVLGQDQDSVGGGFETEDSFEGMLSNVNVWDRVLSVAEVKSSKSCLLDEGNVYRWSNFLHEGGTRLVQQSPCKRVGVGMWQLIFHNDVNTILLTRREGHTGRIPPITFPSMLCSP